MNRIDQVKLALAIMNQANTKPETVEEEPMDEEPKEDIEYEVGSKGLMARVK